MGLGMWVWLLGRLWTRGMVCGLAPVQVIIKVKIRRSHFNRIECTGNFYDVPGLWVRESVGKAPACQGNSNGANLADQW